MRLKTAFTARMGGFAFAVALASLVAGCDDSLTGGAAMRAYHPIPPETLALMRSKGTTENSPVLIRTYKKEAELEIWKMQADGRYTHLKTFPMCRWSGQLGPKTREGDRQVPEGFYSITPGQMNPNSAYYLSFNVGYPNAYDRALGRGGGSIMVHGVCSSAGCFSMTDEQIAEIYAIAREGFNGGQRAIQMQSYPFHMTAENMAKYRADPNIAFWKELKEGADNFEVSKAEVNVGVCGKHYVFNQTPVGGAKLEATEPCPALKHDDALQALVEAKQTGDEGRVVELISQGVQPIRTVYADGGQNPAFAHNTGGLEVSRPDALAQGPVDIAIEENRGAKKKPVPPAVQLAAAKAEAAKKSQADAKLAEAKPSEASSFASAAPAASAEKSEGSMIGRMLSWKSDPAATAVPLPAGPSDATVAQKPSSNAAAQPPRRTSGTDKPQAAATPLKPISSLTPAVQKPATNSTVPSPQNVSANASADQH